MADAPDKESKPSPEDLDWLAQTLGFKANDMRPAFSEILSKLSSVRCLVFDRGKAIVAEGEKGDDFFVIRDGTVSVEVQASGSSAHVTRLNETEFFGEIGFLTKEVRTATVRTQSPTTVFRLGATELLHSLKSHPELLKHFEETARQRLLALSERISRKP